MKQLYFFFESGKLKILFLVLLLLIASGSFAVHTITPGPNLEDIDADGIPDFRDIDSDNDGLQNNLEGQNTETYRPLSGVDTHGNGMDNVYGNGLNPVD